MIAIEWVYADGPERALPALADVWPMAFPSASRASGLHSWWTSDLLLVTRAGKAPGRMEDFAGRLSRFLPRATPVQYRDRKEAEAEAALCRGEADGLLVGQHRFNRSRLDRRPACRDIALRVTPMPGAAPPLSNVTPGPFRAVAKRFRDRIDEIAADGAIVQLVGKYPAPTKGPGKGTGLGLASVREIV